MYTSEIVETQPSEAIEAQPRERVPSLPDRVVVPSWPAEPAHAPAAGRRSALLGGGVEGNEKLTATVGAVLILLLAVMGATILRIGELVSVHQFVGLMLAGPVALKVSSAGYRLVRYYTGDPAYRGKGAPRLGLRLLAPVLILSAASLFSSGFVLLLEGAGYSRQILLIHKASFVLFIVVLAVHVLAHLPQLARVMRGGASASRSRSASPGSTGRTVAIAAAIGAGLVLAIALLPVISAWA